MKKAAQNTLTASRALKGLTIVTGMAEQPKKYLKKSQCVVIGEYK